MTDEQKPQVPHEVRVLLAFIDKAGAGELRGLDFCEALDAVRMLCHAVTGNSLQVVRGVQPAPEGKQP